MQPTAYKVQLGQSINDIIWESGKTIASNGQIIGASDSYFLSSNIQLSGFEYLFIFNAQSVMLGIYDSAGAAVKIESYASTYWPIDMKAYMGKNYNARISFSFGSGYAGNTNYKFIYKLWSSQPYYSKLVIQEERESGQKFFRQKLSSDLKFLGPDYDRIRNAGIGSAFMIRLSTESSDITKYLGTFNKSGCKFDVNRKQCVPEFTVLDAYTELLNNWENTFDLIALTPKITPVQAQLNPVIQSYIRGSGSISYFFAGTYQEADVLEVIDDPEALTDTYHFAYLGVGSELTITGAADPDAIGGYISGPATNYSELEWKNGKNWSITVSVSGTYAYFKLANPNGVVMATATPFNATLLAHSGAEPGYYLDPDAPNFNFGGSMPCSAHTFIVYPIYQRLLTNRLTVSGHVTYKLGTSDMALNNVNYKRCIGLEGGRYFFSAAVSEEPTIFGVNSRGQYFTNHFISSAAGSWRPLPVCRSAWGDCAVWYAYDWALNNWPNLVDRASYPFTIKDAYTLWDVLNALLSKTAPISHYNISSTILYGNTTSIFNASFYPILAPKTNVLKANYDQPAQKAKTSLKEVLDNLATMFNCYWHINGITLRIEHSFYYDNGLSYSYNDNIAVDITKYADTFNGKPVEYFQGDIEYDNSELYKRLEMSLPDKSTELFDLVTMETSSSYVKQDSVLDLVPSGWATDVDLMMAIPDSFGDDGFALLLCEKEGTTTYKLPMNTFTGIVGADNLPFKAYLQNGYASWIYLSSAWLYQAAVQQYVIDKLGPGIQFATKIIRSMVRELRMPLLEEITAGALINTDMGTGQVISVEHDLISDMLDLVVIYEPD